jgi:hypothetical protein
VDNETPGKDEIQNNDAPGNEPQDKMKVPQVMNMVDLQTFRKKDATTKKEENKPYPMPVTISSEVSAPFVSIYNSIRMLMNFVVHQIFRDITVLGTHNIPKTGPIIFCGNHQNQFIDGCILYAKAQRDVRFMVAAKVSISSFVLNTCSFHLVNAPTSSQAVV